MFGVKNRIFLELSKTQKSALCSFLRNFTKKHQLLSTDELVEKFIENETYYFEVGNAHFEWILPLFEQDRFLKEISFFINECKKMLALKEAQRPMIESQKLYMKEQRKILQKKKMQLEPATKKQLYLYDKLCKKHALDSLETANLSKFDLKVLIGDIIAQAVCEEPGDCVEQDQSP